MDKGLTVARILALLLLGIGLNAYGQIYKIVDKDGNVTFTDQAPGDGTQPMVLPELSVISTDLPDGTVPPDPTLADPALADPDAAELEGEPTQQELRRLYSDFRITRPANEETFWGTANTVVFAWETTEPLREGLSVRFTIDGSANTASRENMMAVTLDRGTHTVSAAIVDARGRTLVTTDAVTFFVHQQSVGRNGP